MSRSPRLISKSGYYHVMTRGNEKKKIFIDNKDKEYFVNKMKLKSIEMKIEIIAYVLMDNHIHLLLYAPEINLGEYMKKVNVSYAMYFNKKYTRVGHLFQDRYRSEGIENDSYLLSATRYIHRNPLKAQMVKDLRNYKWSSFNSYLEKDNNIVKTDLILEMLSDYNKNVIAEFKDFHNDYGDDIFIEYEELTALEKTELVYNEAKILYGNFLKQYSLSTELIGKKVNIEKRNIIINEIKNSLDISERQIARVMMIDKGIVNKALKIQSTRTVPNDWRGGN